MTIKEKKIKEKKIVPRYFSIKLEIMCPVLLTYRILAETPEEALIKVEKNIVNGLITSPKPHLGRGRKLKGQVFSNGTNNVLIDKKY